MRNRVSITRFHEIVLWKPDFTFFLKSCFHNTSLSKIVLRKHDFKKNTKSSFHNTMLKWSFEKKKKSTSQRPRMLKLWVQNTILTVKIVGSRHDFKKSYSAQ